MRDEWKLFLISHAIDLLPMSKVGTREAEFNSRGALSNHEGELQEVCYQFCVAAILVLKSLRVQRLLGRASH